MRYYEHTYPIGAVPGTAYPDGMSGGIVYAGAPNSQYATGTWFFKVRKRINGSTLVFYDMAGTVAKFSYFNNAVGWVNGGTFANSSISDSRAVGMGTGGATSVSYAWHAVVDARL